MFDREDMLSKLVEFKTLYENRPIKDNNGGMKSPHMFPAWYAVQKLKPKTLIESGVWKGLGTWFFEQASPDTKIISIDPEPRFREYTSNKVSYRTRDFLETDWNDIDKDNSLVFFDDHQDAFERLKACHSQGFKRIIVEDNYPAQQGDCYTPQKMLDGGNFVIDKDGVRNVYPPVPGALDFYENYVSLYKEAPPIFVDAMTRWGVPWDNQYPTEDSLLEHKDKKDFPTFFSERFDYTWLCYLELKNDQPI